MNLLVAGGSGFVGRHLVTELLHRGHSVRVMTRRPSERTDGAEEVAADVHDSLSLATAMHGMDAAYYLVHALDSADFVELDRDAATKFGAQAASVGLQRVVYLGGLGDDDDDLSAHLRSRREVEQILTRLVPTTALRAGIVVGDGGVSWEILCQLVERLPLMITPKWVQTRTQPIALPDVVGYLADVLEHDVAGEHFEVGTPDPMTYEEMMETVADELQRSLHILSVPVLSPGLSARWLQLTTDVDGQTARSLVDSMTNEVVVHDRRIETLTGRSPMPFRQAAQIALRDRHARKQHKAAVDAVT